MTSKKILALALTLLSLQMAVRSDVNLSQTCPRQCRCYAQQKQTQPDLSVTEFHANCSEKRIRNITEILSSLSRDTTLLDLSKNSIALLGSNQFIHFPNLTTLLLNENLVRELQPHSFRGLRQLRTLDLRRNRIKTIRSDAFHEMSGADGCEEVGSNESKSKPVYCGIDLTRNDLVTIERNAFSWTKKLSIYLGHSQAALNIDPYAFYGAQQIPYLVITDIPSVTFHARLFTNVEDLKFVVVSNTKIKQLKSFVFEGLKHTHSFKFSNVSFATLEEYALSGVQFTSGGAKDDKTLHVPTSTRSNEEPRQSDRQSAITFHDCSFRFLPTDVFRDANVARVSFTQCNIGVIRNYAFRGMAALQSFHMSQTRIGALEQRGFGSLRNLQEIHLKDMDLNWIVQESFLDISDIQSFQISVTTDLILDTAAFSGCSDIQNFELYSSKPKSSLQIATDAFRNFVSVDELLIRNFSLATLDDGALQGMTKIKNLRIENCEVSHISQLAFGDTHGHQGAIENLRMDVGNNLTCDCQTVTTLRQLRYKFFSYSVPCRTDDGQLVEAQHANLSSTCVTNLGLHGGANTGSNTFQLPKFLIFLYSIVLILLWCINRVLL